MKLLEHDLGQDTVFQISYLPEDDYVTFVIAQKYYGGNISTAWIKREKIQELIEFLETFLNK